MLIKLPWTEARDLEAFNSGSGMGFFFSLKNVLIYM